MKIVSIMPKFRERVRKSFFVDWDCNFVNEIQNLIFFHELFNARKTTAKSIDFSF